MRRRLPLVPLLALYALAIPGCGAAAPAATASNPAPLFALLDVNPDSVTSSQIVSPRDYEGFVSAWYFGSAT